MPLGAFRLNSIGKVLATAPAGPTFRADTYSSNVQLAVPFDNDTHFTDDVAFNINGSLTGAKTKTQGASSTISAANYYWTSSPDYGGALLNDQSGQALTYDLSSQSGSSITSAASGTYVVEGWFRATNATTNNNWALSSADSGGRWLFGMNTGTTFSFGNENNIGLGTGFHHVANVCDGGTKRFYYDGVYKGAWVSSNTGFSTLHVGQFNAGDSADFRGNIQDLRVTVGSNRGYTGTNSGSANFTLPSSIVESF